MTFIPCLKVVECYDAAAAVYGHCFPNLFLEGRRQDAVNWREHIAINPAATRQSDRAATQLVSTALLRRGKGVRLRGAVT